MPNREKVIKGLECCMHERYCTKCPYCPDVDHPETQCDLMVMDDALALLKQEPVGGWISVKDRLPVRPPDVCGLLVRRQWYLVALESGAVLTLSYEFDEDRWQGVGSPVTHWMPLPNPPKGVK